MKAVVVAVASLTLVASAALAQSLPLSPQQAIAGAAASPENGIEGRFEFVVRSVGETAADQGVIVYLNSEPSYRSPDNISAMIMPLTAKAIARKLGGPVKDVIVGKRVIVTGSAKQTRIDFIDEKSGKPVGQYYFQTRISVKGPDQIEVL